MGKGSSTTTTTGSIPGAAADETQLRGLLSTLASSTSGQFGDLSSMASGNISASDSDRQFIETAQNAAAEIARKNAENNFASQKRLVEEQLLSKGMEGGSIEAVTTALMGKSNQDALNNINLQQQGQAAEQMTSLPFQRAGVQLSANQLLLQKLLGAANPVMQQSLQERLAQGTTTSRTETSPGAFDYFKEISDLAKKFAPVPKPAPAA